VYGYAAIPIVELFEFFKLELFKLKLFFERVKLNVIERLIYGMGNERWFL